MAGLLNFITMIWGDNYANTFRVKDGKIVVSYDDYNEVFIKGELFPQHYINSSSKTCDWDEWVTGEFIVYGDSLVIHIVNGEKVLEYTKPQIGVGVANSFDPSVKIDGKPLKEGYIGLQAEGQGIEFREIKIKKLD